MFFSILCFTIFYALSPVVEGIDFQDCPFPPSCTCNTYKVYQAFCQGQNFTSIPKLYPSALNGSWFIDFSYNMIKHIPANAFENITVNTLWISNNNISIIDEDAFTGSESIIESLRLKSNNLIAMPSVLKHLSRLNELTIENNPIKDFNESVIRTLSQSLTQFYFGSSLMISWPESLKYLVNLKELGLFNLPMNSIPEIAFDGFMQSLELLQIESTQITKLPLSINGLTNLYTVIINYNKKLKTLPEEIFKGLNNIHTIILQGNAIVNISAIFKDSSSLNEFALLSDTIREINEPLYPVKYQHQFQKLTFKIKHLASIPKAVSNISSLIKVEISGTNITEIKSTDFQNLTSLETLLLFSNPIKTINKDAFVTLHSLGELYLGGTKLTTVPEAIKSLRPNSHISLDGNDVQCTCEGMAWMKTWKNRNVTYIDGQCVNLNLSIYEFQTKKIPKC